MDTLQFKRLADEFFNVFESSLNSKLHLFDKKYIKSNNIVKY